MNAHKNEQSNSPLLGIFFLIFGFYLLAGAVASIAEGAWPFFMPAQLDIVGLVFGIFGDPVAGILGGIILGFLGLGCIYLFSLVYRNEKT